MSTKIICSLPFFLIIIFSNYTFCIRNEAHVDENAQGRNPQNSIKFSADDAVLPPMQMPSNYIPDQEKYDNSDKLVFSTQSHQSSLNILEDIVKPNTNEKGKDYTSSRQTNYQSNFVYNTGEFDQNSNYHNKRPVSNYHRPDAEYATYGSYGDNSAVEYPYRRDNPYYSQNNYATNYNTGNQRPNYNQRPTPPPPPPREPSYQNDYPYQQQQYESGKPYPQQYYPNQQQSYDYPSYASLFNNFQALPNPLASLFGGFGSGSSGPSNPLGTRINKALEDISANDDLNCVPKLLCQMVGNPERRSDLPSFLSAPAITSLIAALPISSPALIYGRAALLGFTGGEASCGRTYNKCPSNEDDLLYYLNNHRGGFFRFFNGGEEFSDTSNNFYDSQGQRPDQRPQSLYSESSQQNVQSLLGSAFEGGSGLNLLGSLASFLAPSAQNTGSNGLVSVVGNLLGGLGNERRSFLKRSTRSIDLQDAEKLSTANSNHRNTAALVPSTSASKDENDASEPSYKPIEGRILNSKTSILADPINNVVPFKFPNHHMLNYADDFGYNKGVNFDDHNNKDNSNRYPTNNDIDEKTHRLRNRINFHDDLNVHDNDKDSYSQSGGYLNNGQPYLKMIFPDRTGTGNLRFDNDEFIRNQDDEKDERFKTNYFKFRDELYNDRDNNRRNNPDPYQDDGLEINHRDHIPHRKGKILSRPSYSKYDKYYDYDEYYNKRKPYYSPNPQKNDYTNSYRYDHYTTTTTRRPYYNRYETTTRRPNYYNENNYGASQGNRYTSSQTNRGGGEGNIYVTNAKGVVEYYITPNGQKVNV